MTGSSRKVRILCCVVEGSQFTTYRLDAAVELLRLGYDVHVAGRMGPEIETIRSAGFVPHHVPLTRGLGHPVEALAAMPRLRRVIVNVAPDVVHSFSLQSVVLTGIASLGLSNALVHSITGLGSTFLGGRPYVGAAVTGALRLCALARRAAFVVQNTHDRDWLGPMIGRAAPPSVVPGSGVSPTRFSLQPLPPSPVTFAYVGRMVEYKGVRTVVEAHRILAARGVGTRLILAGDADDTNPQSVPRDQLREWGTLPGVEWLGHVEDVRHVWARSHAAVLPSHGGEGVPKSLIEAAACGRPAVASDVPGCRDIVREGVSGILVPPKDPLALAEAMASLARSEELLAGLSGGARRLACSDFSAEAVARAYSAVYTRLMRDAPRSEATGPVPGR